MRTRLMIVASASGLALSASASLAQTCARPPIGPDVIVGVLHDITNYTPSTTGFDAGYDAFSLGTTSCNLGNVPVMWYNHNDVTTSMPDIGNKHPAIAQAVYKYTVAGGAARFEQLGQSFLKHGFLALSQTACCTNCVSTDGNTLGVGCSDPYSASRNGGQSTTNTGAGPKFQVNAATGTYPWPIPTTGQPSQSGQTFRRLRMPLAELNATTGGPTATIRYFGECQYVTWDDAQAGNKNNNASIRELSVSGSGNDYTFAFYTSGTFGTTNRQKQAIRVWKEIDPRVVQADVEIPNDGLVVVSSRAYRLTGGTWRYEYAVYNMNSDRSVGSLLIPMADSLVVSNIGFHDVQSHSGDGVSATGASWFDYDGTDWPSKKDPNGMIWACKPYSVHQGANAIRWGTTYNFRFDTIAQPTFLPMVATVGLFKPGMVGEPASMISNAVAPAAPGNADEIFAYLDLWFANQGLTVNTDQRRLIDLSFDNVINADDLFAFLDGWFANQL